MAPSFFSKLVKSSSGHGNSRSRSSSAASSPTATSPSSRAPSISVTPASASPSKTSYEARNGSTTSTNGRPQLAALTSTTGYESSDSGPGPNVTVIPPSPNVSENSIPLPDPSSSNHHHSDTRPRTASDSGTTAGQRPITNEDGAASAGGFQSGPEGQAYHRRLQSLPAISPTSATATSSGSTSTTGSRSGSGPGSTGARTSASAPLQVQTPAPGSVMSPSLSDDGLATPTPSGRTTFIPPVPPLPSNANYSNTSSAQTSRSNEDMPVATSNSKGSRSREGSLSSKQQKQAAKQRSATVAEGAAQQHLQTPKELRHSTSNRSLRSKLSIMLPGRGDNSNNSNSQTSSQNSSRHERTLSAPASPPANAENSLVLVDSPTGLTHPSSEVPSITHTMSPSTTNTSMGSSLTVPDNSDAVSITSVGSATSKKRRPWRRGSNPNPATPRSATLGPSQSAGSNKSPSRKGTTSGGLASALAASGLAMVNPGLTLPPLSPGDSNGSAGASGRPRRSLDTPGGRSRGTSINYGASDYSDRDSFHSGQDAYSDDEGSSESDELDLDPDDIPVTGFAVASNKRNQDFHELFPTVPEGDYLIEDYGCALQREILIQGRLYISENHVCFHANIFGWITDLSIPMSEVVSLEKRMTAFVIPNAIQLSTRTAKYTFTSFLSRDTTFDVLYNVWRLARPENSSVGSLGVSPRGSLENGDAGSDGSDGSPQPNGKVNGATTVARPMKQKVTQCECGKAGQHYTETAMEATFPGTPEKIYNLMFTSGFIKDFMREGQKLIDIQISDWMPTENPQLLARNMSYIKPLNGSIGPKQTKCEIRDETVFCDFDKYVTMVTTTRTPEVPSGGVFSVKTRTCITWASSVTTKVLVTTQVEWSGRSFIKGIIEKSCLDGQKQYHNDLEKAMREYIHEHASEFIPEGVDVAVVEEAEAAAQQQAEAPQSPQLHTPSQDEARKARERERNRRSLQWAYDTFDGAFTVAKRSTEGALELLRDAWDQSSMTTILWFIIVFLLLSNIWTLTLMGSREEVGRRKEMRKTEEREKWVQGIVTALWEELLATRGNIVGGPGAAGAPGPAGGLIPPLARTVAGDWREELGQITGQLDVIEQRVREIRQSLNQLDQLD
ncbi:hypothetical protein BV20DRAFT_967034 [Pilatotrama ljubarskyi]|nr:hypothetical protein BV20DRAFT_967034 [Pilatotrama ljubarskyi]